MENNSMTLTFAVNEQTLMATDAHIVVENSLNYLYAEFTFTSDWDNTTKYAIVEGNDLRYKVQLNANDRCKIPNEIIKHDGFRLMLVGENENRYVVITTTTLKIKVFRANYDNAEEPDVKYIRSTTLNVAKDGDLVDIEIPNIYFKDANLTNDVLNFLGLNNVLLKSIEIPYGKIHDITIAIDNTTYVLTLNAYDKDNTLLFTRTADFNIEGMLIESASYDSATQELVLVFHNGNTVRIPISDILTGIATESWVNENFYTKTQSDNLLAQKQNTLVNQVNIKSINNVSIVGSGNIDTHNVGVVELDFSDAVDDEISITDAQLALMQKEYAVLKVGTNYFDKKFYDADNNEIIFLFEDYFQTIQDSGVREYVMEYITVNTSEKTATYHFEGNFSFYEKYKTDELLATKQNVIDSTHKLSSDLVDDTSANNKFVTTVEKNTWNAKQDKIDSAHKLDADLVDDTNATNKFVSASEKAQITANQNAITAIKDGTTIDSFADVESALSGKQNTLSGSTSIDITSNVVSVKESYIDSLFLSSQERADLIDEIMEVFA